ncbi:hypothetical protein RFI_17083 [Reticulomyxa filosa]|uniref:CBF1-interacting co-repressor CIR N-terminal domain-containing protein n=1 Tax=Reticulomyxa filosa TaxID=46433 RepID=X6N220_RETFI|nr:hypothetical protein RFI_17083 [Reticulomyxa filosa]|eukprot:ETO20136.1 hypothetical protein RFI_17083 [Reticulomyxa filosa]
MGKGLGFLSLKFYHPTNRENQQRKWEALQRESQQQKRLRERQLEQQKEKELLELRLKIVQTHDQQQKNRAKNNRSEGDSEGGINITGSTSNNASTERSHYEKELHKAKIDEEKRMKEWREALQHMSREERRLAEKEMEEGLSVHERNARRFEFLQNAPVVDDYVKNIEGVVHKPFGKTIKHVKCFKCGKWGHSVGDRECEFSADFTNKFAIPEKPTKKYVEEYQFSDEDTAQKPLVIQRFDDASAAIAAGIEEEKQDATYTYEAEEEEEEEEEKKDKKANESKEQSQKNAAHLLLTQDEIDKIEKEDPLVLMKQSTHAHHQFNPYAGDDAPDHATSNLHETRTVFTLHKNNGDVEDDSANANAFVIKNIEERAFNRNDLIESDSDSDSNNDNNRGDNKVTIKKSMLRKLLSGKERYESEEDDDHGDTKSADGNSTKKHKHTRKSKTANDHEGLDEDVRFINSLNEGQKKKLLKQIEKDLKRKKNKEKKKHKKNKNSK